MCNRELGFHLLEGFCEGTAIDINSAHDHLLKVRNKHLPRVISASFSFVVPIFLQLFALHSSGPYQLSLEAPRCLGRGFWP